jgi:hypothetical protein
VATPAQRSAIAAVLRGYTRVLASVDGVAACRDLAAALQAQVAGSGAPGGCVGRSARCAPGFRRGHAVRCAPW